MTDPAHYDLRRVHFIGIGGSGMSGLARILAARDAVVTGSDVKDSTPVEAVSYTHLTLPTTPYV